MIFRLLTRRVGQLPAEVRSQLDQLSIAQLEDLGEALLDFSQLTDLEAWLQEILNCSRAIAVETWVQAKSALTSTPLPRERGLEL